MEPIRIYIVPKVQFDEILQKNGINEENVEGFIKIALISINDSHGEYFHKPFFKEDHHNVLQLWFDDIEHEGETSPTNSEKCKPFSNKDAKQILNFLKANKTVNTLIIHCAGGISRSGAVGKFALNYLNGDRERFKIDNGHINPNGRVLRMLNEEERNEKKYR